MLSVTDITYCSLIYTVHKNCHTTTTTIRVPTVITVLPILLILLLLLFHMQSVAHTVSYPVGVGLQGMPLWMKVVARPGTSGREIEEPAEARHDTLRSGHPTSLQQ